MLTTVSKSQFKPKALEYLRLVEELNRPLIITHGGKPVVRVIPYTSDTPSPQALAGTVISYVDPTKPIAVRDWEAAT